MRELRVGFESALDFWRAVRLAVPTREANPDGRIYGARALSVSEQASVACNLCHTDPPLDVVVPRAGERLGNELLSSHLWSGPMSEAHLVSLGDGIRVSRPEVVFVQLSLGLDEIDLAEIAYELAGTYVLTPDNQNGFVSDVRPLVGVADLRGYASAARTLGVPGAARAMRALDLVAERSNSPRETCAGIFLATPRSRGGAGAAGFSMNAAIQLPEGLARMLGQRRVTPDFSWPNGTVGEYDSDSFHRSPAERARDERKRRAYQSQGLDCLTMSRETFSSNAVLDLFVDDLQASLGLRRRPPSARMLAARRDLRERLFGPESTEAALRELGGDA